MTNTNVFVGNVNSKEPTPQFTPTEKVKFAQIDAHTIQVMLLRIFLMVGMMVGYPFGGDDQFYFLCGELDLIHDLITMLISIY